MISKTQQWSALAAAAVLTVLTLGWFLLVSPARGEAAQLDAQAAQEQAGAAALRTQLRVLQTQAADLPVQRARLLELRAAVPDDVALPSLIRQLTAAARESQVDLNSIAPSPPVQSGGYSQVNVSLVVEGGFFAVQQFLSALEDLPRAFVLNSFTLTPGAGEGDRLQLSLTGAVFTLAGSDGAGPTEASATGTGAAGADSPTGSEGTAPAGADELGTVTDAASGTVG